MEENYFIRSNYHVNPKIETIESGNKIYWTNERISQSFYAQYSVYKLCRKLIKIKNIKSVLDIGCGPANKLMKLIYPACNDVYGIDQERMINFCIKHHGLKNFFTDDIENSNLNLNKKFDLIISSDVIEHLDNPNNLISYIKKYSNDNTFIIISTPERDILRGKECSFSPKKDHVREWNKQEFHSYLKHHGFEILAHIIGENFKIYLNFKNPLPIIKSDFLTQIFKVKRFNNLKKIKHCQIVLCKINKTKVNINNGSIISLFKNFEKPNIRDVFKILMIEIYLLFFDITKFLVKIKRI